jgi:hypothetical protein
MGLIVLVIGESGRGKSASLRSFTPGEVGVFNVAGKPLPFKSDIKMVNTDDYARIKNGLKEAKAKTLVIDDAQYLMSFPYMRRAKEKGYEKFVELAASFWELIDAIKALPEDKIVYIFGHVETDNFGNQKFKTIGKMLDSALYVDGLTAIVLRADKQDSRYFFRTQSNGQDTAKTPMGMFDELEIDNDLKYVDARIREYYGLPPNVPDVKPRPKEEKNETPNKNTKNHIKESE